MHPIAVSVFSGAGGMDIGFTQAGFDVKIAIEVDPSCCETLSKNFTSTAVWERDIKSVSGEEILETLKIKRGQLDLFFGGPPCQSFSLAGERAGLNDPRGQMVGEFIRLTKELAPKAFVMENVKGMLNWQKGAAIEYIEEEFKDISLLNGAAMQYHVSHTLLNAVNFGVPQNRERVFIVGNRLSKSYIPPSPTHGKSVDITSKTEPISTVGDAIGSLPAATPPSATALRVSQTIKGRREKHGY